MDITWYGMSCFRIIERGETSIVTDPYADTIGLPPLRLKADVVTVSHDQPGHNALDSVKGYGYSLLGPGEYEVGGVFIYGIPLHHVDEKRSQPNVAYKIEFSNNLTVLHLGDLSHVPDQSTIEDIGEVNVVLVPVGGGNGLKAGMAAEVIALIEPQFIVPMHYALPGLSFELDPVEKFLKTMGVSKVHEAELLRVGTNDLPEQPQVVILTPALK